jgi:hypothetical protein
MFCFCIYSLNIIKNITETTNTYENQTRLFDRFDQISIDFTDDSITGSFRRRSFPKRLQLLGIWKTLSQCHQNLPSHQSPEDSH